MVNSSDYVAKQTIIDTYVPLPFKAMQEALNQKQLEYDTEEKKLADMPSYLKANIRSNYTDTQGNSFKNANYDKYIKEANAFNNEIKEASKTLSSTSNPHEVKKLTSEISNRIANWKIDEVKPAEDESANYDANFKKLQEDNHKGQETYRAYKHDLTVRSQVNRDLSKGYIPVGFSDQLDYSDINKNIAEAAKGVPLNETSRKSFLEHTSKNGAEGFKEWEKTNGDNSKEIKKVIDPLIQEHTPHIKAELVHTLANNQKYYDDMLSKGYNPNDENSILQYAHSSETTHKVKEGKNFKEVKSNLLQDFFDQKKMDFTSAALGYTKSSDKYSEKFDVSEFLTKDKKEKEESSNGYVPTNPTSTDLINFKYDSEKVKDLSFKDYLVSIGESKTFIDKHDFDKEVQKNFIQKYTPDPTQRMALDKKKEGKDLTILEKHIIDTYNTSKEIQDKRNTIYKQYDIFKNIDKLSDQDFSKKISEVNPIAKAIVFQFEKTKDKISKKDLLERLKVIENQKNLSGVAINLREKEADNQWYSLFGKKDEGSFNNAKALKWTDRNTGETTNFDSIEIDGTKIKDLKPSEIIEYKKEGRIGIPKFEYPIASEGGQSVEIDGKTYTTGGETFKEKSELAPMSAVNSVLKQPLQTAGNNGFGKKYDYKAAESDSYIVKKYGISPTAIQGYTDYKTLENSVIVYGENNKIVGKIPLDEYNKGTISEVGSGFVQPSKIKGLDD